MLVNRSTAGVAVTTTSVEHDAEMHEIEIRLLLDAIRLRYGYDFRQYRPGSLSGALSSHADRCGYGSISSMIPIILRSREAFGKLFMDISAGVTGMFRDPGMYASLRRQALPALRTYPFVNIWNAGCATGEEAYSMAIFLEEEGLLPRSRIYATDINDVALRRAETGIYRLKDMQSYAGNYKAAGCHRSLGNYYHIRHDEAEIHAGLKDNIVFSNHNLAADSVFSEIHLVVCKNVLIYFNEQLQNRVLRLLTDSLCRNGFLCLGEHESLECTSVRTQYDLVDAGTRIYRKRIL